MTLTKPSKRLLLGGVICLMAISIIIAVFAFDQWRAAHSSWQQQANMRAQDASRTWLNWLQQYQETLLTVLIHQEASEHVSEDEFFTAIERLEYSWERNRTVEVAVLKRWASSGDISVVHSSVVDPALHVGAIFKPSSIIASAIATAAKDDRLYFYPMNSHSDNATSLLISAVGGGHDDDLFVVSLIYLQELLNDLSALNNEPGFNGQLTIESIAGEHLTKLIVNGEAISDPQYWLETRFLSAGANWHFRLSLIHI